jgi:hypothetical protein
VPGGAAGLQNQSGGRKDLGGFDSLPSPPTLRSRLPQTARELRLASHAKVVRRSARRAEEVELFRNPYTRDAVNKSIGPGVDHQVELVGFDIFRSNPDTRTCRVTEVDASHGNGKSRRTCERLRKFDCCPKLPVAGAC